MRYFLLLVLAVGCVPHYVDPIPCPRHRCLPDEVWDQAQCSCILSPSASLE